MLRVTYTRFSRPLPAPKCLSPRTPAAQSFTRLTGAWSSSRRGSVTGTSLKGKFGLSPMLPEAISMGPMEPTPTDSTESIPSSRAKRTI